jgi:hypothetical protein
MKTVLSETYSDEIDESKNNDYDKIVKLNRWSKKKIWWICRKNKTHSWKCRIDSRTSGSGCPFCSGKKVNESNSLSTLKPDIAKEWDFSKNHPLTPHNVSIGTEKKVYWICKKGHSYHCTIGNRVHGVSCTICQNKGRIITNENNFEVVYPILSELWDNKNILKPCQVYYNSSKYFWWKCRKDHSWEAKPSEISRTLPPFCPFCSNRKAHEGYNITLLKDTIKEWDYNKNTLDPKQLTLGSEERVWWKCSKGHSWKAKVCMRTKRKTGCPKCKKNGVSTISIKWLESIMKKEGIYIKHYMNSDTGEYKIILENGKKIKVDGYCIENNTVYEYDGCYYHGHPATECSHKKKYQPEELNKVCKKKFSDLYKETLNKRKSIRDAGYNLVYIWGCEYLNAK